MDRNEVMYFFSGNRDLVGFLFGFLADKPHHLLDLLGDICVVHFCREGFGIESEKIERERRGGKEKLFRREGRIYERELRRSWFVDEKYMIGTLQPFYYTVHLGK